MKRLSVFNIAKLLKSTGCMLALYVACLSVGWSSPTVSGNVISWSSDDWHLVQNVQTLEVVCQGGSSCEVPEGIYTVEGFFRNGSGGYSTRVVVGNPDSMQLDNESFARTLTVNGYNIQWSEPGWYQVQSAADFESVCNGTPECAVASDGVYIVTNHSLGLRTEVTVGPSVPGGSSTSSVVQVNGLTISWPDDGWYQVQSTVDYTTLCEGGRSCTVEPGLYKVINHTTGEKFEQITVLDLPEAQLGSVLSMDNMADVVRHAFEVFTGKAYDRRLVEFPYSHSGQAPVCVAGAVVYAPERLINFTSNSFEYFVTNEFSNCEIFGDLVNGRVYSTYEEHRQNLLSHTFSDNFRVERADNDVRMELEGTYRVNCCDDESAFYAIGLNYSFSSGEQLLEVTNAQTYLRHSADNVLNMGGSFALRLSMLAGEAVSVSTDEEFFNAAQLYSSGRVSAAPEYRFDRGRLIIAAADSEILVDANTGDPQTVSVTVSAPTGTETIIVDLEALWGDALRFSLPAADLLINDSESGEQGDLITESNLVEWFGTALDVFSGAYSDAQMMGLPDYSNAYYMHDPNAYWGVLDGGAGPVTLESCVGGGLAEFTPFHVGAEQTTTGFDFNFDRCSDGVRTYNGQFSRRSGDNLALSSNGFSWSDASNSVSFSGMLDYGSHTGIDGQPESHYRLSEVRYESKGESVDTVLNAQFGRDEALGLRTIRGGFTLISPQTNGKMIVVGITSELTNAQQLDQESDEPYPYFSEGVVQISAPGGNRMIVRVGNGKPDSVQIEFYKDGVLQVFEKPWSEWSDKVSFRSAL